MSRRHSAAALFKAGDRVVHLCRIGVLTQKGMVRDARCPAEVLEVYRDGRVHIRLLTEPDPVLCVVDPRDLEKVNEVTR